MSDAGLGSGRALAPDGRVHRRQRLWRRGSVCDQAATPAALGRLELPPGPVAFKAAAAIAFMNADGLLAGTGGLTDACAIPEGRAGTRIIPRPATRTSRRRPQKKSKFRAITDVDQYRPETAVRPSRKVTLNLWTSSEYRRFKNTRDQNPPRLAILDPACLPFKRRPGKVIPPAPGKASNPGVPL
jgi:hypothetical protein